MHNGCLIDAQFVCPLKILSFRNPVSKRLPRILTRAHAHVHTRIRDTRSVRLLGPGALGLPSPPASLAPGPWPPRSRPLPPHDSTTRTRRELGPRHALQVVYDSGLLVQLPDVHQALHRLPASQLARRPAGRSWSSVLRGLLEIQACLSAAPPGHTASLHYPQNDT